MATPPTKIEQLRTAYAAGDYITAIRIASRFGRLPTTHRATIQRAWAVHTNPDFYRAIGIDPDRAIRDGIDAIRMCFIRPT